MFVNFPVVINLRANILDPILTLFSNRSRVTGITGQDGLYLADWLLDKGTRCTVSSGAPPRSTRRGSMGFIRIRTA
jgi:hypothetical protein